MSTKLVRLDVPEALHRRIKTLAAYKDQKIPEYMLEVLDDNVPKGITFSEDEPKEERQRKPQSKLRVVSPSP